MTLRIGSCFSGIGGLELGLERALSAITIWQVERDPYCRAVLAKHWPHAQRFDDVCTVGAADLAPVDLICGGFPCQDISVAGAGAGLDGERSGLWREYRRIIEELAPSFVVIENVAALRTRGLDRLLHDLAALGFDAEWDGVPAAAVGAPHLRDRLFVVAYAQREHLRDESVTECRGSGAAEPRDDGAARDVADTSSERSGSGRARRSDCGCAWEDDGATRPTPPADPWRTPSCGAAWAPEPAFRRVVDGPAARVDVALWRNRLRALGNAVVPQVAEHIGRVLIDIAIRERIALPGVLHG